MTFGKTAIAAAFIAAVAIAPTVASALENGQAMSFNSKGEAKTVPFNDTKVRAQAVPANTFFFMRNGKMMMATVGSRKYNEMFTGAGN